MPAAVTRPERCKDKLTRLKGRESLINDGEKETHRERELKGSKISSH